MSTLCCSEDQLQFFSGKKARLSLAGFHEALELNPTGNTGARTLRRLLLQRGDPLHCDCSLSASEAYALHRFLPSNREDDDDEESPDDYACDDFRMYEFKVRRCTRSRSHDWTDCPFAHPGEKARRRDPRRYNYSGTVCLDFRKGGCRKGDVCEFAHGVFECWLHPERYRTQPCKDGRSCRRKVCFFAHTPQQLRILPLSKQVGNALSPTRSPRCCTLCSSQPSLRHPFLSHGGSSPDSPLMVGASHFSPPSSPPLSSPVSPVPTYFSVYRNMLTDLSSSIEALDINSIGSAHSIPRSVGWAPLSSFEERNQSAYSTSMPSAIWRTRDEDESIEKLIAHKTNINNNAPIAANDPDFDWVNELLM